MQEKERMFAWAKTLLSAYKYLDTVTNAIDNLVRKQGVNSCFYQSGYYNSTLQTATKMIELTSRKQKLMHVKLLVEDALTKLPASDVRLLVLTYFDLLKSTTVSETMGISLRTFFRKKQIAITKFGNALKFMGYNCDKLTEVLEGEGWLIRLYEQNLNPTNLQENDEQNKGKEYLLLKYIMKDISNTKVQRYCY